MRVRWTIILLVGGLGGCSWLTGSQKFSVYFDPYSAKLDQQSRDTIDAAAKFARAHPMQPIAVDGFSALADPKRDADGLSAQRAEAVKQALISDGIFPNRITAAASGVTDPKSLPSVAVRRVDIAVGQ
jgi:outer membrane protein OmpA-like peptidoglycan-associated protein